MLLSRKPKTKTRPFLIVQALIRKNTGQYLLIKRADDVEIGCWEFPGGRVDPGETIEKALEREIMEETNLKVDIERFVGWGQGFDIHNPEEKKHYDRFVMFFEVKLIKGKFRPCSEFSDHKWVTLEEIARFKPLSKPVQDFVRKFQVIPDHLFQDNAAIIK